jgi:hypothetical protein
LWERPRRLPSARFLEESLKTEVEGFGENPVRDVIDGDAKFSGANRIQLRPRSGKVPGNPIALSAPPDGNPSVRTTRSLSAADPKGARAPRS